MSNTARRGRSATSPGMNKFGAGNGYGRPNPPPTSSNFVPGGQLHQAQKPLMQMPQQQQQQASVMGQAAQQQIQQQQINQPAVNQQQQSRPPPQQRPPPQLPQQTQSPQQQPRLVFKQEQATPQKPLMGGPPVLAGEAGPPGALKPEVDGTNGEVSPKQKPDFVKRGRISKKEKRQRRNQRMARLLQPKNALMVLNELIGAHVFEFSEGTGPHGEVAFKATIKVEGREVNGFGKNKTIAKNHCAEEALKVLVLKKLGTGSAGKLNPTVNPADNEEEAPLNSQTAPMETDDGNEENAAQEDLSWSHLASFALHKLLNSWDDAGNLVERILASSTQHSSIAGSPVSSTGSSETLAVPPQLNKKPAKSLPANPEEMNPVMLMNQMRPGTTYEEVQKSGNPPHTEYLMKSVIEGNEFFGKGPNKKAARTQCAFEACHKILGINYPPGTYEPVGAPPNIAMQIG